VTSHAPPQLTCHAPAQVTYGRDMGRLILILLAAFLVFIVISAVISALHFLFSTLLWVAIVGLLIYGALRLSGSMRRSRG
jgi:uncharacterized integral membrane protein